MLFDITQRAILAVALAAATFTPLAAQASTSEQPPEPVAAAPSFTQITTGLMHTCGLAGGDIYCWGANGNGQLGDDNMPKASPVPMMVNGIQGAALSVTAGDYHTCAIKAGGAVSCWGMNYYGQLGDGFTDDNPVASTTVVGLSSGVTALAAGNGHTCALLVDATVKCWGSNGHGQLGDGTTTNRLTPVAVVGLAGDVIALTAGNMHTCALLKNGGVQCWGANGYFQLGDGSGADRHSPVGVDSLYSGVAEITARGFHTCARLINGGVKCWGSGWDGDPADMSMDISTAIYTIPTDVTGLSESANAISTGFGHTCVVLDSGHVACWGLNWSGQLGNGTATASGTPVIITGLSEVTSVASGWAHTCALLQSGGVVCWGNGTDGELGNGDSNVRAVAQEVSAIGSVTTAAPGFQRTCAVTAGGTVKCWGARVGDYMVFASRLDAAPVDVPGLTDISAITAGAILSAEHNCVLTSHGGLKCWGSNWAGQVGDNSILDRADPVDVISMTDGIQAVSAGGATTCALTVGGAAYCWGGNWAGQVGDGSSTNRRTPVAVTGLGTGVAAIDAGAAHTCALLFIGGLVTCWGNNTEGQLGDGTQDNHPTAAPVVDMGGAASAIALGSNFSCALMGNGHVKCWGGNESGQLGNGTTVLSTHPGDVTGITNAVAIAAGESHACAILASGGVQCWGLNDHGQLGDGTTTNRTEPVAALGLDANATGLWAGVYTTCVTTAATGRLKCFGWNGDGELGIGTTGYSLAPANVVDAHTPLLRIGYAAGKPGSRLTLTGTFFAANGTVTFKVNGVDLVGSIPVTETGEFVVFLDTTAGAAGSYDLTAAGAGSANVSFTLDGTAAQHDQEGGGTVIDLPAGIAHHTLFLPDLSKH